MKNYFKIQEKQPALNSWLKRGAWIGAVAGAIAANVFICGMVIFWWRLFWGYGGIEGIKGIMLIFLLGQILGTLPAILIGLVTGIVTGLRFHSLHNRNQPYSGAIEGLKIATVTSVILLGADVMIIHFWVESFLYDIGKMNFTSDTIGYSPVILLYLLAGAWGGKKLAQKVNNVYKPTQQPST